MTTPPAAADLATVARREMRSGLVLRASLAVAGAAVCLVAAVLLARAAVVDHVFPGYVAGEDQTVIPGYSGPLWAVAIGVGALAGLLVVSAVADAWRWRGLRHVRPAAAPSLEQ